MSFTPALLGTGLVGWKFLQRTQDRQLAAFKSSPVPRSDVAYFVEHIAGVRTAADLVADRRLLSVALGAFGLQDDLDNRAFVRKILEDGTASDDALANRLADKRYRQFSAAFGFGPGARPATTDAEAMARLVERYFDFGFQAAVGEQDNDARIALYAGTALQEIVAGTTSDTARWYAVLADMPLRQMFQTTFGLPTSFSQVDLDRQVEVMRERTRSMTGDPGVAQFADPERREALIERFLLMSQLAASDASRSPGAIALSLLQAAQGQR